MQCSHPVVVFRVASRAVAEAVVPFGFEQGAKNVGACGRLPVRVAADAQSARGFAK